MPNIRRKNGKFQARLTVKGKSLTATFPTREAADAWCLATRQELQLGKHADVQRAHQHTFCQLLDRYAEKVTPKKRGQHQELQRIRMLRSHPIAQRIAGELTSMDFADLRDELSVGRKPNTVRLYLSVCQQVCACPSSSIYRRTPWYQPSPAITGATIKFVERSIPTGNDIGPEIEEQTVFLSQLPGNIHVFNLDSRVEERMIIFEISVGVAQLRVLAPGAARFSGDFAAMSRYELRVTASQGPTARVDKLSAAAARIGFFAQGGRRVPTCRV